MTKPIKGVSPRPLRLRPGVIAMILLFLTRFGVKAIIAGLEGFMWAIGEAFGIAAVILLWRLFFSRALWSTESGRWTSSPPPSARHGSSSRHDQCAVGTKPKFRRCSASFADRKRGDSFRVVVVPRKAAFRAVFLESIW
jgi:hypothetical protein